MAGEHFGSLTFVVLTCLIAQEVWSKPSTRELDNTDRLLQKTLTALKGTLEFFNGEYKNVNLDAAIGTRMVDGKYT